MTSLGVAAAILGDVNRARFVGLALLVALLRSACGGKLGQMYDSEPTGTEVGVGGEGGSDAAGTAGTGNVSEAATKQPPEPLPEVECAAPLVLPDPALQECFSSSMRDEGLEPASFENLKTLTCGEVVTLAGLECLTGLETLYLGPGSVDDLRPLAALTRLVDLRIGDSPISDVGALAGLTSIRYLQLVQLELEDIGPLSSCGQRIIFLWLMYNRIRDIGPLVSNRTIGPWTTVWLGDNPLDCSSQNQDIKALRERLVTVYTDCGDR